MTGLQGLLTLDVVVSVAVFVVRRRDVIAVLGFLEVVLGEVVVLAVEESVIKLLTGIFFDLDGERKGLGVHVINALALHGAVVIPPLNRLDLLVKRLVLDGIVLARRSLFHRLDAVKHGA